MFIVSSCHDPLEINSFIEDFGEKNSSEFPSENS
jgi:hypothetical protein